MKIYKNTTLALTVSIIFFLFGIAIAQSLGDDSTSSQGLATETYTDTNGYFTIVPPEGWEIREFPYNPRLKGIPHLRGIIMSKENSVLNAVRKGETTTIYQTLQRLYLLSLCSYDQSMTTRINTLLTLFQKCVSNNTPLQLAFKPVQFTSETMIRLAGDIVLPTIIGALLSP